MQEHALQRRAEIKRAYKEAPVQAGVYAIKNLKNGKLLVASHGALQGRFNRHRFELSTHCHECQALQADWDSLGQEAFAFEVLEELKPPEPANAFWDQKAALLALEKLWLNKLQPYGEKGYNE
jgi:hypothetical protein